MANIPSQTLKPITSIDNPYTPKTGSSADQYLSSFEKIISNTLAVLSIIGAIMFAVNFLIGALNWISAGGDQGKIDKAKKQMTSAAIGLIVIAVSYAITYIVGLVTGINILYPGEAIQNIMK